MTIQGGKPAGNWSDFDPSYTHFRSTNWTLKLRFTGKDG